MFLYTSNANASYAYQWNIDGENLSKGQSAAEAAVKVNYWSNMR